MDTRSKTGIEILEFAVVIGLLGDMLLRSTPWGLNVFLFNTAFAAGMITLLYKRAPGYLNRQTVPLFGVLVFFASMFAWRDSIELRIADTFAIIATLSVLIIPTMKMPARMAGVFQYGV